MYEMELVFQLVYFLDLNNRELSYNTISYLLWWRIIGPNIYVCNLIQEIFSNLLANPVKLGLVYQHLYLNLNSYYPSSCHSEEKNWKRFCAKLFRAWQQKRWRERERESLFGDSSIAHYNCYKNRLQCYKSPYSSWNFHFHQLIRLELTHIFYYAFLDVLLI